MLRLVTRQRLLIALTIATSMGVGYALAQQPHMDASLACCKTRVLNWKGGAQ